MASECPYDFISVLNKYHKEDFFQLLFMSIVMIGGQSIGSEILNHARVG